MSWEEFSTYWADVHGPLVQERAEVLGIVKYQQVRTRQDPELHNRYRARNGGSWEEFDGIAEVWLDPSRPSTAPREAIERAQAELRADEAQFIDLPNSPMWLGEERVFVDRTQ
jgi:hypothetical protein